MVGMGTTCRLLSAGNGTGTDGKISVPSCLTTPTSCHLPTIFFLFSQTPFRLRAAERRRGNIFLYTTYRRGISAGSNAIHSFAQALAWRRRGANSGKGGESGPLAQAAA